MTRRERVERVWKKHPAGISLLLLFADSAQDAELPLCHGTSRCSVARARHVLTFPKVRGELCPSLCSCSILHPFTPLVGGGLQHWEDMVPPAVPE